MTGPHGRRLLPKPLVGPPSLTLRPATASHGGRGSALANRTTIAYDAVGRLTTMEDLSGVTTYGYTDAGELATVVYPGGKTVTYTYDAGSRRATMVDPDGGVSTYSYDAGSRLTSLLNPFAETTTWVYDALGRATTLTFGNTTTVTLAFDAASRITGVRNAKSDGTEIAAYAYTRDNVGNPTAVALTGGDLLTFSYDANYRLTREQRSGANAYDVTYTFDQVGNRTAKIASGSTTTYTFNAMDQLTTEQAPAGALTTYSFDAAGNNTVVNADGTFTTYSWDLANRMTGAALPGGGAVTFVYDATGLRRSREDASGLVRFVWDGQNVLQETDSGGTTQAQYTCGTVAPGGAYGPVLSQRRSGTSAFYHADALATINRLTDASQAVTDAYVLDAWGRSVSSSGSTVNPHRYVGSLGYYTEPDFGMDYVRARWLRPATGSWVSVDPVDTEPRYGYVGGRVGTSVDPSGRLTPEQWSGAAWGFWGGGLGGAAIGAMCSTTRVEPFDNPYRRDLKTCENVRDACLDSAALARRACERIAEFGFEEGTVTGYCVLVSVATIDIIPFSAVVIAACAAFTVSQIGQGKWNDRRCRQQWEDAEKGCYERYRACRLR